MERKVKKPQPDGSSSDPSEDSSTSNEKPPNLGEASLALGMAALFPDEQIRASALIANTRAIECLEKEFGRLGCINLEWLKLQLDPVAQRYWIEYERDARITFSDMKKKVAALEHDLTKLIKQLDDFPERTKEALNANVSLLMPKRLARLPDYVTELRTRSILLRQACNPISSRRNVRGRAMRFERCAADLWAVRERITKQRLAGSFDVHQGQFTTSDAAFVHEVMLAIDENVTVWQVQNGLRKAAQAKSKRK